MSKKTDKQTEIPYEDALKRLETIVSTIEKGDLALDKSLDHFEEGMKLAKICENHLNQAQGRIEKIVAEFGEKETIVALNEQELKVE